MSDHTVPVLATSTSLIHHESTAGMSTWLFREHGYLENAAYDENAAISKKRFKTYPTWQIVALKTLFHSHS